MTLKYLMDENVDPVYAKQLRRRESIIIRVVGVETMSGRLYMPRRESKPLLQLMQVALVVSFLTLCYPVVLKCSLPPSPLPAAENG